MRFPVTIFDNDKAIFFQNLFSVFLLQVFVCSINVFVLVPRLYKPGKKLIYAFVIVLLIAGYSYTITQTQNYFFRNYFSTSETLSKDLYHFTMNALSITRHLLITFLIALAREWILKTFRESEQKTEQAKTEIHFLRSQLNPHFLFNTLNSIYGLVITQSPQAKEIILKLSDIMKYDLV